MNAPSSSSPYLTHINGLRALAILAILFYHLRASYCPAGYFGVDIFLVISGFLLFRSLLKQDAARSFNYGSFWLKKAWRILPSWFLVTIATCGMAMWLMSEERVASALHTARFSAVLGADYEIDWSGDYFNVFSQQNPLLHFWYLSITEQLYLIAPLLVVPLVRFTSRKVAAWVLGCLGAISLTFYVLTTTPGLLPLTTQKAMMGGLGMQTVYYHLLPRFWEILAGVAVLLMPDMGRCPWLRSLLAVGGLAAMLVSFFLYETGSPAVYLAVAGAMLTLRYGDKGVCAHILAWKPMQAVGAISFSLYLWHWPAMVFWKYSRLDRPDAWDEVGMIALSLLLGTVFWFLVERLKTPGQKGWVGTLLRCSVLLTLPLVYVGAVRTHEHIVKKAYEGATDWFTTRQTAMPDFKDNPHVAHGFPELKKESIGGEPGFYRLPHTIGDPKADHIPYSFIVIGDSHASHLYVGLDQVCREMGVRGIHLYNSCTPYWFLNEKLEKGNAEWNKSRAEGFLAYMAAHPEIRYVLIGQYWENRLSRRSGTDWRTGKVISTNEERRKLSEEGLRELCARLKAQGKTVVLLGGTPLFERPAPMDEMERCKKLKITPPRRCVTVEQHEKKQKQANRILRKLESDGCARYIDLAPALLHKGEYPAMLNGEFLYGDCIHLTLPGSVLVARRLVPALLEMAERDGVRMKAQKDAPAQKP